MIIQDNLNNGKPYLECPTCGLRFQIEGFPENPQEIRETEWFGLNISIADIEKKSPLGSKCQISQKCVDKSTERWYNLSCVEIYK